MGKKTKKTRWRTLPIDVGASSNDHDNNHNHHPCEDIPKLCHSPVTTETKIYFNEDEYTKITTPRQDVLFKKGYFARRRYQLAEANSISDPNTSLYEIPNGEYVEDEDYFHEEYDTHAQGYYNSTHTYIPDPSAGVYYNYGNSSYEVYDPYTGSMTVLMGPPPGPPYSTSPGAPPLTAPMSVDWYNSTSQHASPYYTKRFPGDSSQTYTSPESMCPPTSPQDVDDPTLYPHSFIYPGYMLAANTYHTNGVGVPALTSLPQTSPCDSSNFKKRKRRKKRKRDGMTEEEDESSSEDQCSHSGASEQLDSKTTSDSGVHTHNSGESTPVTPPLSISFHPVPTFPSATDEDAMPCFTPIYHPSYNTYPTDLGVPSVIEQPYGMQKRRLKPKRPKVDLNKFFPSACASLPPTPCSFHSSVPIQSKPVEPAPKQLTILKPETPRKFPPNLMSILKSNPPHNENTTSTKQEDSTLTTTTPIVEEEFKDASTVKETSNENASNLMNCSNVNAERRENTDNTDNRVDNKNKDNTSPVNQNTSSNIELCNKGDIEDKNLNADQLESPNQPLETKCTLELNNSNEKTANPKHVKPKDDTEVKSRENLRQSTEKEKPSQQSDKNTNKSQLNGKVLNGEGNNAPNGTPSKNKETSRHTQSISNGHVPKCEDKFSKRSPSPPVKKLTNGFHPSEKHKSVENSSDKGNQKHKQKTKKNKTLHPVNNSEQCNGYDKTKVSKDKTKVEVINNIQNGHSNATSDKTDITLDQNNETLSSIQINKLSEPKSEVTYSGNLPNGAQENKKTQNDSATLNETCKEQELDFISELENSSVDENLENKFETSSDKSEELEELYIKNNPLLAHLVDIETLHSKQRDVKRNEEIVIHKKVMNGEHLDKKDVKLNGENIITDMISREKESVKIGESTFVKKEQIKSKTLDGNKRLTDIKEDNKTDEKIETTKVYTSKKKSEKKKKPKENKIQSLADINAVGINKTKEKSPEPLTNNTNKFETKEKSPEPLTNNINKFETKEKSPEPLNTTSNSKTKEKSPKPFTHTTNNNKTKEKSPEPLTNSTNKRETKEKSPKPVKNPINNKTKEKSPEPLTNTTNKCETKEKSPEPLTNTTINSKTKEKSPEPLTNTTDKCETKVLSIQEICSEKKVQNLEAKTVEKPQHKSNTNSGKRTVSKTDIKCDSPVITQERKSTSPDKLLKRKNSKKKKSSPPPIKTDKKETAVDAARTFIDEILNDAVSKVNKQLENVENIIKDIPVKEKVIQKLDTVVISQNEPLKVDTKGKTTEQDSRKSPKTNTKSKTKTPERRPSEPPAMPVIHLTDVVTKWLKEEHGGKLPVNYLDDDDEEVFVQPILKTGSKNLYSNPSPAAFPNGTAGDRVANQTSDNMNNITERCNAKDCVSKYYNLGIRTSPENDLVSCEQEKTPRETQFKYPASPVPCGICCMIQ
ncbi:hypothetical protein M8J77_008567 [Diaphorina citri]|nr:hypothetical protein M8J77_008567 [Diaphorina citri]